VKCYHLFVYILTSVLLRNCVNVNRDVIVCGIDCNKLCVFVRTVVLRQCVVMLT
jgi:hypothetical protein